MHKRAISGPGAVEFLRECSQEIEQFLRLNDILSLVEVIAQLNRGRLPSSIWDPRNGAARGLFRYLGFRPLDQFTRS
ncbi:hypothetical protein LCM4579_24455 [Ensifer sp. LCM 4579]|nr:hypothetical protein LCM4579_24455 [Ensifer sp. LCM 4579]